LRLGSAGMCDTFDFCRSCDKIDPIWGLSPDHPPKKH
jgi:hypothetical protein